MNRKIVITKLKSKRFLLDFNGSVCNGIKVLADEDNNIVGNVYVGRVENVVKNINAAFVEIQKGVKCYYSLNDNKKHIFLNRKNNDAVNIGDKLLVQVHKEAIKTKPAAVTSKIEIPGKYIVVSADVEGVLISSKIKKNPRIEEIKKLMEQLLEDSSKEFGIIVRTNAAQTPVSDIIDEAKQLISTFSGILEAAPYRMFYEKLYSSLPEYCNFINDIPVNDLEKIVTDQQDVYNLITRAVPGLEISKTEFYEDDMLALNKLYSVETLLKHATDKKVWLKSGGYLVIEQTEAMAVIDVNSGKQAVSKKKAGSAAYIEENFFKTNMEAAEELCRQLRLRNLSGIIIVDFINMKDEEHNKELLKSLSKMLKQDIIPAFVVDITKLGLVEITRKSNGKSLYEQIYGGRNEV